VRVDQARLRLIEGHLPRSVVPADSLAFQSGCVEAFVASWTARGFAASTIDNDTGVLERAV
jgi:integrase/recombinase XerD